MRSERGVTLIEMMIAITLVAAISGGMLMAIRISQVMDLALALEALTLDTSDYTEAIASFREKRAPKFGPVYGSEGTHK